MDKVWLLAAEDNGTFGTQSAHLRKYGAGNDEAQNLGHVRWEALRTNDARSEHQM
jgi:hypothetical protein